MKYDKDHRTMIIERVHVDIREKFKRACMRSETTMRDALITYMEACGSTGDVIIPSSEEYEPNIDDLAAIVANLQKEIARIKKAGDVEDPTAKG